MIFHQAKQPATVARAPRSSSWFFGTPLRQAELLPLYIVRPLNPRLVRHIHRSELRVELAD